MESENYSQGRDSDKIRTEHLVPLYHTLSLPQPEAEIYVRDVVVRVCASWAGGCGFDPQLQQTKVFNKIGSSSGFSLWRSGLRE